MGENLAMMPAIVSNWNHVFTQSECCCLRRGQASFIQTPGDITILIALEYCLSKIVQQFDCE